MLKGNAQTGDKTFNLKQLNAFLGVKKGSSKQERKVKYMLAIGRAIGNLMSQDKHQELIAKLNAQATYISELENPSSKDLIACDMLLMDALNLFSVDCKSSYISIAQLTFEKAQNGHRHIPCYGHDFFGNLLTQAAIFYWYHYGSRKIKSVLCGYINTARNAFSMADQERILKLKSYRGTHLVCDALAENSSFLEKAGLLLYFDEVILPFALKHQCEADLARSRLYLSRIFLRRDVKDVDHFRAGLDFYLDKIEELKSELKQLYTLEFKPETAFVNKCYATMLGAIRYTRKAGNI